MDRSRLAGMCYIAYKRAYELSNRIDYHTGIRLMKELNVKHWRNWMHIGLLLEKPYSVNEKVCAAVEDMTKEAQSLDIEVCAMNHTWYCAGDYSRDAIKVPDIGTDGYRRTLNDFKTCYYTMGKRFKNIRYWEVGNEWNHNLFVSKCSEGNFTLEEKAIIAADMMRAASDGVHEANPDAVVVMGGLASLKGPMSESAIDICEFFRYMFEYAGQFKNRYRDCFEIANWHPYFTPDKDWQYDIDDWTEANRNIFKYIKSLGYNRDGVWITEFGFSDVNRDKIHDKAYDEINAGRITDTFGRFLTDLPFVEVVDYFRLFDDIHDIAWSKSCGNGEMEGYFGLIKEDLTLKQKAKAYKSFAESVSII